MLQHPSSMFIHCRKFCGKLIKTWVLVARQDLAGSLFYSFVPFFLSQVISKYSIKISFTLQPLSPSGLVLGKGEISVLSYLVNPLTGFSSYVYMIVY